MHQVPTMQPEIAYVRAHDHPLTEPDRLTRQHQVRKSIISTSFGEHI